MPLATGSVTTTNDLIVLAMETIQELGIGEVPDAYMLSRGLLMLNELLGEFTSSTVYIPYQTPITFTMTVGQANYAVSNTPGVGIIPGMQIVEIVWANYIYPQVAGQAMVYPLRILSQDEYYSTSRQLELNTTPGGIFLNNVHGESQLVFYPAPALEFQVQLQCKCFLTRVEAQTDLAQLPPYYYGFMRLALARKLRGLYPSSQWADTNEDEYQRTRQQLQSANPVNVAVDPSVILTGPTPFFWNNILSYGGG